MSSIAIASRPFNAETKRQLSKGELAKIYRKFVEEVQKVSGSSGRLVQLKLDEGPALRMHRADDWFIGIEVSLAAVTIGGAWMLYFSDRKRQLATPR